MFLTEKEQKVCKFGGTSLASAKTFEKVRSIVRSDGGRVCIVVSAPGKRFKKDEKVTDLLYSLYRRARFGAVAEGDIDFAFGRFFCLKEKLGLKLDLRCELNVIKSELDLGEDRLVSRGEYLSAKMFAEYLNYDFVDAADIFVFDDSGALNYEKTEKNAVKLKGKRVVVPGFYGAYEDGRIKLFSRGGSDVSGAILAAALGYGIYENFTDVSGVCPVDPRLDENAKPYPRLTYDELDEILSSGACVLNRGAIPPLKKSGVKLVIKNTFRPEDQGTLVTV